jgi:hypothetical protein
VYPQNTYVSTNRFGRSGKIVKMADLRVALPAEGGTRRQAAAPQQTLTIDRDPTANAPPARLASRVFTPKR